MQNTLFHFIHRRTVPMIATVGLAFFIGCSSTQPSRFYILTPDTDLQAPSDVQIEKTIGINIVALPIFLERPQIVERLSEHEISMAEFNRWPGSLKINIASVISRNVDGLVPHATTVTFPWNQRERPTQEVQIKIQQFDGQVGETTTLVASWTVLEKDKTPHTSAKMYTRTMDEDSYMVLVQSMSELLADLSKDIVAGLQ